MFGAQSLVHFLGSVNETTGEPKWLVGVLLGGCHIRCCHPSQLELLPTLLHQKNRLLLHQRDLLCARCVSHQSGSKVVPWSVPKHLTRGVSGFCHLVALGTFLAKNSERWSKLGRAQKSPPWGCFRWPERALEVAERVPRCCRHNVCNVDLIDYLWCSYVCCHTKREQPAFTDVFPVFSLGFYICTRLCEGVYLFFSSLLDVSTSGRY